MNIIRTAAVELGTIPAIAYKLKLANGGSGLKLMRQDSHETAVYTIDRRTGDAVPYGKADLSLFPWEAVDEALELTAGLPYSSRGRIKVSALTVKEEEDTIEEQLPSVSKEDMVNSDEYKAIVERYKDSKGRMNYALMNKEFIQFASKSSAVAKMVDDKMLEEDILLFILKSRATFISGNKESLSDEEVKVLMETLDDIDPRGAFKELKSHLRRMLARG